jgi:hypothetical protein
MPSTARSRLFLGCRQMSGELGMLWNAANARLDTLGTGDL